MKAQLSLVLAFYLSALMQGCDGSGIGCSKYDSFIPSSQINLEKLSRPSAIVNATSPAMVESSSYLSDGQAFSLSIRVKNTSSHSIRVSEISTFSKAGSHVRSSYKIYWIRRCISENCDESKFEEEIQEVVLAPNESTRIVVEIKLSDVKGINELEHQIKIASASNNKLHKISWTMTRIEQKINCIYGTGYDYRVVQSN